MSAASKNYYEILCVGQFEPDSKINAAFRKLAIENHPKKNPKKMAQFNFIFSEICEAYEVLSTRKSCSVLIV